MSYVLGIDIGSSSEKAAVFDDNGNTIATAVSGYEIYSSDKTAEQDVEQYLTAFRKNMESIGKEILSKVSAICICGQTPTDIFVDKNGKPLRKAVMWKDLRAKSQYERLTKEFSFEKLESLSGCYLPRSEAMTPVKMARIFEEEPEVAEKTYKVLQPKDYLVYKLTGNFVTDLWCGRFFRNVETGEISEDIMKYTGFDESVAPNAEKPETISGTVVSEEFTNIGLKTGTPVVCGSGDGFASMLSSGVLADDGIAFNSTGTSEMAGVTVDFPETVKNLYVFPKSLTGEKAVCFGPTQSGGASLLWFARSVLDVSFEELTKMASKSRAGADGLVFLPYISGERAPIWDSSAKGCFFGIKASHTANDFARSVLEGVAFSIKHILEFSGRTDIRSLRISGGGSKVDVWNEIRAGVLGVTIETSFCEEACALGAAMIAGKGTGTFSSYKEAAEKMCRVKDAYLPKSEDAPAYERNYEVYKNLYNDVKKYYQE